MLDKRCTEVVSKRSRFGADCAGEHCRPIRDLSLTTRLPDVFTLAGTQIDRAPEMSLNSESKYPSRRTFVLKLRGDARPEALVGRLENLVTGRQLEFASAGELLEAIAGELVAAVGDCPEDRAVD